MTAFFLQTYRRMTVTTGTAGAGTVTREKKALSTNRSFQNLEEATRLCSSSDTFILKRKGSLSEGSDDEPQSVHRVASYSGIALPKYENSPVTEKCDFTAYENGSLSEFLKDTIPQRVSDVCLVNDHHILVKMPVNGNSESYKDHDQEQLCSNQTIDGDNRGGRISRYFAANRIRKVTPAENKVKILGQEPDREDVTHPCPCMGNEPETEVYESRTKLKKIVKVRGKTAPVKQENHQPITKVKEWTASNAGDGGESSMNFSQNPIVKSHVVADPPRLEAAVSAEKQVTFSPLRTSLKNSVTLENHGFLEASQPATESGRHSDGYRTFSVSPAVAVAVANKRDTRHSFGLLHWLRNIFCLLSSRGSGGGQGPPNIHAAVYKTYFVRWQTPPIGPYNGYGVRRASSSCDPLELRRCRSAVF